MRQVYHHCATAARDAGQKEKETMYKRKSLAAAGAISKLLEATQIGHFEKEERECHQDGTAEQDDESFCKPDGLKVSQLEEH